MESCDGAANARGDDEQRSGEDKRTEDKEQKLVHVLMILQRGARGLILISKQINGVRAG